MTMVALDSQARFRRPGTSAPGALRQHAVSASTAATAGNRLRFAAADGDQLGDDRDGDLLRGDRADVEADRGVHVLEVLDGDVPSSTSTS